MMMEKVPMTSLGYAALEDELKKRQSVERPRIIEHIAEARSHGDLSENAEYHAAKEEQSHNEGRIAELEDKLARADIIDISKLSGDTIKFGVGGPITGPDAAFGAHDIFDAHLAGLQQRERRRSFAQRGQRGDHPLVDRICARK